MIKSIHFILTYMCNSECDHCFVFGSPKAKGTFAPTQLRSVFSEIDKIKTIESVYFEGGEPFLFFPLMLEGVKLAKDRGLLVGIVTNAYWATSEETAELYLEPLAKIVIDDLSLSDDAFHIENDEFRPSTNALKASKKLGITTDIISIEEPKAIRSRNPNLTRGEPIIGGDVVFRGRAVDSLISGLPKTYWKGFNDCPYEDLKNPKRVHVDSYGCVHLCQGLLMGNMWQTPLSKLVYSYDSDKHPIASPILKGGPTELAKASNFKHGRFYVDACHLCYECRKSLLGKFPEYLGPANTYGIDDPNF
ncbi:radical SAM protein [Chloroflexota bacterium]